MVLCYRNAARPDGHFDRLARLRATGALLTLSRSSEGFQRPSRMPLSAFVLTRCWQTPVHHPSSFQLLPLIPPETKLTFPPAFAGLLSGLTVSLFSKPLALLLGLLVLGIQGLEYQGIHIVPYGRLQRWFTNTDVKSALRDNVALKVSFGTAFALAGFVSL